MIFQKRLLRIHFRLHSIGLFLDSLHGLTGYSPAGEIHVRHDTTAFQIQRDICQKAVNFVVSKVDLEKGAKAPVNLHLQPDEKINFLRQMLRIRRFEQQALKYYNQGSLGGFFTSTSARSLSPSVPPRS